MLELEDKWIWDSWYAEDQGLWHAFFLQADKSLGDPELRHWNVSYGHATSHNLADWTYHGTVFAPAQSPAFDDYTTWTGSVVRGEDGLWHLFYTGTSHAEDGLVQRIGHATSTDLSNWTRQGMALERSGPGSDHYEGHVPGRWKDCSMRDPWVMRDPEGSGWLMFFTARSPLPEDPMEGGAIGLARSPDLQSWTLEPPIFTGAFAEIEVPTVFEKDGRWFCLFCTPANAWSDAFKASYAGAPVSGIHYLWADAISGPWRMGDGPFLDDSTDPEHYAPRWLNADGRDLLMRCILSEGGEFRGVLDDPVELATDGAGRLVLSR